MKTLKKFEFKPATGVQSKYNWDKFLDGNIYQFEEGEGKDYTCNTQAFRNMAVRTGAKRGLHVNTQAVEGGCVIQQDRPLTDGEKAEWVETFKAQKEASVLRRAAKKAEKAGTNGDSEALVDDEPGIEEDDA
jgi:hypothetical protein